MSTYYRPEKRHQTEIVVVNSRFITTIDRATSVQEARDCIAQVRQSMLDASHHVYAFRIGYGNSVIEGMSDHGEPSGTAGPPTLAILKGYDIGDVVSVTTRYFGGTKLGTGGLVRAYSDSAKAGLETLPLRLKAPKTRLGIELSYSLYELSKRLIVQYHGVIEDESFGGTITLIVLFLQTEVNMFTAELVNLSAGSVSPLLLEQLED